MNEALWYLGRSTGVAALVLLTICVMLGILTRHRAKIGDVPQFALTAIHRRASLIASGLIVLHMVSLLFDSEAQLNLVDLLVPFLGTWSPLWLGLGTLAVDILFVLVATSLLRKRISFRLWRRIHFASYALWLVAVAHSLGTGTDSGTWWALGITIACVVGVVATWLATWVASGSGVGSGTLIGNPPTTPAVGALRSGKNLSEVPPSRAQSAVRQ